MSLVIVGAGSWVKNLVELFDLTKHIYCFFDEPKKENETKFGRPIKKYMMLPARQMHFISSVGDPRHKRNLINDLLHVYPSLTPRNFIHRSCVILPSAHIGEGVYMQPQNIVYARAQIGNHVSMCGACNVGHDSIIGDYCTLSPRTLVCGNVTVGDGVFFGVGACVLPGVKIGEGAIIGAGSVVNKDIYPNSVWAGVPVKHMKRELEPW
jgi:sugar O-acyltransferase (sialic acid O-acetyltransferase NeuD family)